MARFKLLSFFIRGKPVQRWYDFKIHRFAKKPEIMYRLSLSLNYVPIHWKYRSYLFHFWTDDREEIDRMFDLLFEKFLMLVGEDLGSQAYANELSGYIGIGVQEVDYDERFVGVDDFYVEHH